MKVSFRSLALTLLFIGVVSGLVAAEQLWTCGMHPQIIKKEPGNCPICGMKLTPIRANATTSTDVVGGGERKIKYYKSTMIPGEVKPGPGKDSMGMEMVPVYEGEDTSGQNQIQIDAATTQRMNLKIALVEEGPVRRKIRALGVIAYNEKGLRDITLKYEGWIEKLYVNTTWAEVKTGDPLFEIYSPDLYNAQLNYVVAVRAEGSESGALTRAALARLKLFDVPAEFIQQLKRTGEAQRTLIYRSPADGVVIEKMAVAGQMMRPGERIYRLADLSDVWALAQIFESDLPFVHEGQPASVTTSYGAKQTFEGSVDLLLPQVAEQTRTATARIILPNPEGRLRPGMYAEANLTSQLKDRAVLVPDMAVLRSGKRNTVFVALPGGFFEPRDVELGVRGTGNVYEVISGLMPGERIVTSGQFMLDSESQLREAIQKMLRNATGAAEEAAGSPSAEAHDHSASAASDKSDMARSVLPADVVPLVSPIALAAADAAASLAHDDLAGYRNQLPRLRDAIAAFHVGYADAVHGSLAAYQEGLPDPSDLDSARRTFEPFSTVVSNFVRANGLHLTQELYVFECPMAPVSGRANWLQREPGTMNPFFGSEMPSCGDQIDGPDGPPTAAGSDALHAPVTTIVTHPSAALPSSSN